MKKIGKHSLKRSFKYAFSGVKLAFKFEPNFRVHSAFTILSLLLALLLRFSLIEWLILLFTISLVLITELLNTSLEALVNLHSPDIRDEARVAKDVSAAAVVISAICAFIVGVALFVPKIINFFFP
jgi:diacylglycerol kinase